MNLIHTLSTMWILYAKISPLARIKKFTFITLEFEIVQSFFYSRYENISVITLKIYSENSYLLNVDSVIVRQFFQK